MSVIRTEVAVGEWEDRANLQYVPCNEKVSGYGYVDAVGRKVSAGTGGDMNRRAYLVETEDNVTYIKYDTGESPIFKVTEEGGDDEEGGGGTTDFFKCASVDTANHTWTGYQLIPNEDNGFDLDSTASEVGEYHVLPEVDGIYDATGRLKLKSYYGGDNYDPYGDGLLYSIFINGGTGWSAPSYGAVTTDSYILNVETVDGITARKFNGSERVTATAPITRSVWSYSVWAKRTDAGYVVGCKNTGMLGLELTSNNEAKVNFTNGYNVVSASIQQQWTHIVVTYSNGQYNLYVNGSLSGNGTMSQSDASDVGNHNSFVFGEQGGNYGNYYTGYAANFRFYDHVLTAEEIAALYDELTPVNS